MPLSEAVLKRLAWLDLSDVQHRYATGVGAGASVHAPRWSLSLEYRRFLLLRLAYRELDIPAPPLIDSYWRIHAADQRRFAADCASLTQDTEASPDELVPPLRPSERAAGPEIRELYETIFPCGHADLWGWPQLEPGYHNSAPALGSVHLRLPSAIDEPMRTRLREEAFAQRPLGEGYRPERAGLDNRGSFYGPARICHGLPGPVLLGLHWDGTIPPLITEQTGAIVSPASASYLYYGSADFMGIHTDPYGCELVLLTLLSGSVEQLHCHLHLAGTPPDEIRDLAEATHGRPEGGTPFDINTVPFLFSGQHIPHHREPQDGENEIVMLTQFYVLFFFPWPAIRSVLRGSTRQPPAFAHRSQDHSRTKGSELSRMCSISAGELTGRPTDMRRGEGPCES